MLEHPRARVVPNRLETREDGAHYMASSITPTSTERGSVGTGPLAALRKAAGYRSAREFAGVAGIPVHTYYRWERSSGDPESSLPVKGAWALADALGCTIDAIVGRSDVVADGGGRDLNAAYQALSESGKERLDEYLQFLGFRDRMIASEGR